MSAHALTRNAYGDATRVMGTPRNVEYQVFSQVTGQLNRASAAGRPFGELARALHENLRLWTIIVTDVTSTGNGLPVPLRVVRVGRAVLRAYRWSLVAGSLVRARLIDGTHELYEIIIPADIGSTDVPVPD